MAVLNEAVIEQKSIPAPVQTAPVEQKPTAVPSDSNFSLIEKSIKALDDKLNDAIQKLQTNERGQGQGLASPNTDAGMNELKRIYAGTGLFES